MPAADRPLEVLLTEAQHALRASQTELGKIMGGVTRRTVWRYQSGQSLPVDSHVHTLVRHVFPKDRDLAGKLAATTGETLESLGLVVPPPAPIAAPEAPPPPPVDPKQERLRVDAVVCAAAEALDVPPRSVRAVLYAAFSRAREMGLAVDVVAEALAPKPEVAKKKAESSQKRARSE